MNMEKKSKLSLISFVPYIGLILLILISVLTKGATFTAARNLRNIMIQASILMVLSAGTTFVMAHGDMDFANGGTMGITMVVALALCNEAPAWMIFPICVITGTAIGYVVGILASRLHVVAFIVGMCIMRLSAALLYTITLKNTYMAPIAIISLSKPSFFILASFGTLILAGIVFELTKIGQYNKLIGVNKEAASLSGICTWKYLLYSFMASGLCSGIAAFMTAVRIGGLSNSTGSYEVDVLIALTIGGMPLTGGSKASISAALIGAYSLTILNNILILWGVNADFVNVVKGLVFLVLVLISTRGNKGTINI